MSKITKKDIKELRERYECQMRILQKEAAAADEKIKTLEWAIGTIKDLEEK